MAVDPREPFSDDEADFARLYATLPGGEPPPALDARVLAQARAAVAPAQRRRRPRPWFLMPGAGAAAAAVLAAGLAWQLGWLGEGEATHATQAPAEQPAPQSAAAPKQEFGDAKRRDERQQQRVDIDYMREEQAAGNAAAERERSDSERSDDTPLAVRATRKPGAAQPAPPPPAPPAPVVDAAREQAPAEFVPEPLSADDATPMSIAAPDPAPVSAPETSTAAPAAAPLGAAADHGVTLDRIEQRRAAPAPWPQDAQLAPDDWLERIRERVRAGDRQGAVFSLRRFVQVHPARPVPAELQRLLAE